jgi:transcriptional regulator with XRE-family HTH domain
MSLGPERLKSWRRERPQREVAPLFRVTQAAYSGWETGSSEPSIDNALRIAEVTEGAVPVESWKRTESGEAAQ